MTDDRYNGADMEPWRKPGTFRPGNPGRRPGARSHSGTWGKTPGMQVGIRLLVIAGPSVSAAFARPTRLQSGGSPGLLPLVPIQSLNH